MPSNHLILCHPLHLLPSIFPRIRVLSNESVLHLNDQSIRASASASVLPMNVQGWFPLGLTGLISLQFKGLWRVFSSSKASVLQHSAFFIVQLSHPYVTPGKTIALTRQTFVSKVTCLPFNTLSTFVHSFSSKGAIVFSFHGCSHHPQWFWSPRK